MRRARVQVRRSVRASPSATLRRNALPLRASMLMLPLLRPSSVHGRLLSGQQWGT
jgi:hypothetical protein